jgi:hypothetical protein
VPKNRSGQYSPEETSVIYSLFQRNAKLSEIESALEGRTSLGIARYMERLSITDPDTWIDDSVRRYVNEAEALYRQKNRDVIRKINRDWFREKYRTDLKNQRRKKRKIP